MTRIHGIMTGAIAVLLLMSGGAAGDEQADNPAGDAHALEPSVSSETLAAMDTAGSGDAQETVPSARSVADASTPAVMDEIVLDRTQIRGNQELPKVLYIVPWQKSEAGDLLVRPGDADTDDVLAPIDRPEFIRQVEYYGELYGETDP